MDTRMLDVAIGLAMVFAVTSLFVTAIQEGFASFRNSRGKNLKQAIASMGGDDPQVVEDLFKHPLVQSLYLTKRGSPSYLPSDIFSTALFSVLAKNSPVAPQQGTPLEFLSAIRSQPGDPAGFQQLLESLGTLVAGVENDWPAFEARVQAWYSHTGDRSIGWFKRGIQRNLMVIGMMTAVGLNIDAITIGNALWNDKALRDRSTALAIQLAEVSNSRVLAPPALQPANAPSLPPSSSDDKLKASLEATDRQFKQLTDDLQQLAKSNSGLKEVGELQEAASRRLKFSIDTERRMHALPGRDAEQVAVLVRQNDDNLQRLIVDLTSPPSARAPGREQDVLRNLKESAEKAQAFLKNERSTRSPQASTTLTGQDVARCVGLTDKAKAACETNCKEFKNHELAVCEAQTRFDALGDLGIPLGWNNGEWDRMTSGGPAAMLQAIFGWLITAVAVTLGAPFWFDLLGKLVKLRGSGAKANGNQSASQAPPPSVTAPAPTTTPASSAEPFSDAQNDDEHRLSPNEVTAIQIALGMTSEQANARLDSTTRTFISDWQIKHGIQGTGILTAAQIQTLLHGAAPASTRPRPPVQPDNNFYEG